MASKKEWWEARREMLDAPEGSELHTRLLEEIRSGLPPRLRPSVIPASESLAGSTIGPIHVWRVVEEERLPFYQCECECGNVFRCLDTALKEKMRLASEGRPVQCPRKGCASRRLPPTVEEAAVGDDVFSRRSAGESFQSIGKGYDHGPGWARKIFTKQLRARHFAK